MTTASLDNVVLAESDETVIVEGNHYFPPSSVQWDHFTQTELTTVCGWKGEANYYTVSVDGQEYENVAWTYADPEEKAAELKDYVAFYPQVQVS